MTTKESRWAIPPELEEIKKKILEEAKPKSTPVTPNDVASPLTASAPISGTTSPNVSNAGKEQRVIFLKRFNINSYLWY